MKPIAIPVSFAALIAFTPSALAQSETYSTVQSNADVRMESRVTVPRAPLSALAPDVCASDATTLCLNNSRFQARAIFSAPSLGITNAPAQAVSLTGDTGYFWFFSANNVEITLKVVDGRAFNGFFWAFYAALSDVAYTITITDMDTGAVRTYSNPQGTLASVADVIAFAGGSTSFGKRNGGWTWTEAGARMQSLATVSPAPLSARAPDVCASDATTLCLNNSRFQVRAIFSAPSLGITNAPAQAVSLTGDTGYFWFFSANNVEITLKVVDGRAFNGFFWAFYAALSDVAYTITITDMDTGAVRTYSNPQGTLASVADVIAFAGAPSCAFEVSMPAPRTFESGGGAGTINVLAPSGCTWTAVSNSSFVTVTFGASGNGNGTVFFSVAANAFTTERTGTMIVAGQPVTVTQFGTAPSGNRDGTWTGTNSLTCVLESGPPGPCTVGWTIVNNAFTQFRITYAGACGVDDGATTIDYTTPLAISGDTFTHSSSGSPPVEISFTIDGMFSSNSTASGTGTIHISTSSPRPSCAGTLPITFTATKM